MPLPFTEGGIRVSQHRKSRGMRTQLLVAQYLRERGWPYAESAGAGRSGTDVLGTPDIAVEVKARSDLSPLAWVRQAEGAADGRLPLVAFRCNGQGEDASKYLAMVRLGDLVELLRSAGYGSAPTADDPPEVFRDEAEAMLAAKLGEGLNSEDLRARQRRACERDEDDR